MHNVSYEVKAGKLVITVDVGTEAVKAAPPSKGGATRLVGTSSGACPIPSPNGTALSFALNVMVKP
ncbi:MAG TPA: hypothetical protein VK741_21670 [Acetobacteraceae bacterium]|jgi:hypothetical protein|nr:hypothetical protein [Acetobacteraceae bacterium]